ncbi:Serine/threonine-protein kinase SMG1 [Orchesella cincta]|uniref:Serine/threonine-protein kinase SMG1 n=1 Tax=Orchesella cincta TaxID=48709 RepID=A0A1D2N066_ORCCI|nr:Serine/threonine-protein kinase SMG1 [Orchesella cincta]
MYSGVSTGSSHDVRGRRRDKDLEDDRSYAFGGGGDGSSKGKNEEVRISRLTRLLARMDNEESFLTICGQIEGALVEAENQKYVSRCFQCLCPSFLEVFKGLGGIPWEGAGSKRFALLLFNICRAMDNQTTKLFQWLVDIIVRTARGSQTHVSSSAFVMENVSIHLISMVDRDDIITFIKCVYDVLEDVGNPRVFRVLGTIFVSGTNLTSSTWRNTHFQDFIDMVVGWMVDVRQSPGQFASCTELLDNSKNQFLKDLRFLVTLMSQILEDLEQAIKKVQPTLRSDSDEFRKVLQLVRAFTSLLALECPLEKEIVTEFCDRLVVSTLQFIRMCEPHRSMERKYHYDLLSTVNKGLFYAGGVISQSITKYFRALLKLGSANSSYIKWPKLFLISFFESISVWMEVAVSQTQLPEDILEICDLLLSLMDDMHKTLPSHDKHYVLNLLIALLRTRNVTLLQKTYGWLISKLPSSDKLESKAVQDDDCCLFVLAGLADLISNKGSSILSLWALQPAVFEVLVDVTNMKVHQRTRHCAMELLKTHCSVHSHFVSSIASTGTFNADSPGTRFLPALMDFWVENLKLLTDPEDKWIAEWVFEFLQNTNSYSSLLYQAKPEFFQGFLDIITQKGSLLNYGAKVLEWFCQDPNYMSLDAIHEIIRSRLIMLLFDEKLPERIKRQYRNALYQIPQLIVLPDASFVEDCIETEVMYNEDNNCINGLTSTEFNLFLHELLVANSASIPKIDSDSRTSVHNDNNLLSVAADHLIRMKLKTPLGKPQDFFGQLLMIFKRSRASKVPVAVWKLHFVFELETKFQLWIHGSAMNETDLTEHVKQFYLMNKHPFLEWLKRIRTEIIDTCLMSKEYSLAYFNAALMGDKPKMEYALFHMKDSLGLQGMDNLIGHYFLEGNYEDTLKLIESSTESNSSMCTEVKELSQKMLDDCMELLQQWPEPEKKTGGLENIPRSLIEGSVTNLLDLQLANIQKTDMSIMVEPDVLQSVKLPTIQKIHAWLVMSTPEDVLTDRKESIERIKLDKMLKAGNIEYVKNWLVKKDVNVNNITSDEDLSCLSLTSIPVATLKVCADYYAKMLEYRKSAVLYNILRELVTGSLDSDLAHQVTSSLSARILESDEFFNVFSSESLSHCDRLETIRSLHQVALHSFPECAKSWLSFGDFAYNHSDNLSAFDSLESNSMKYTAMECYSKYIQLNHETCDPTLSSHVKLHHPKVVVMTRLLQLYREGYHFIPQDVINSEDWFILLAELAQHPELRSHLIDKYPEQTALFLSSHDVNRASNKQTVRRRNIFDLSPFAFVDTSEEPLSSSVILSNLSQLEKKPDSDETEKYRISYEFRSYLNLPACATVFAQELLRLASPMEEMWVWSLERVAVDWMRRLTYLRKECARTLSSEKIRIFINPILTYLQALLSITSSSHSPADVNFINRHKNDLQKYIDLMFSSCSLEDIASAMNSLLKYSERFGILVNNKLALSLFSPKLADPNFYEDSNFSICLPGQSRNIKICSLHAVVHALPTKTKPKRIRILASNGKYYDYLVKGTENLNIDCGVMQFLKVAQSLFNLPTRTYSVTPLGKRGGLIQIVPDAVPLFTLYKKHLQRNKSLEKTSEMFWRRMNDLGYEDRSSLTALREVYETLCSETSCDLITRELLLAAGTPSQWLDSVRTFTRDCSVGSGLGFLLGIGDRHLDNMLVNVNRGKFIHVDFTIIFGKGTTLRVPEKVPFRLTQNVASVLQFPGPSGVFSVLMQKVLTSIKDHRETAIHLIRNIAFCQQYDEDAPVDLTKILLSEVNSAVQLFLCRLHQDLSVLHSIRCDVEEIKDSNNGDPVRKLSRKMNRWRRMLINVNTVLQFISSVTNADSPYAEVASLVNNEWTEHFQACLEMGMEQQTQQKTVFLQSLDATEKLLIHIKAALESITDWNLDMMKLQDSALQIIDLNKVEVLVKYAEMNIQSYNPASTVTRLVEEATSVDNLSQMYEGWTSWV